MSTDEPQKQMTPEILDIFRAQAILDGRNGSKYIPKSFRTAKYRPDYVRQAVNRAKNRKTNFMQRLARKINRMFS